MPSEKFDENRPQKVIEQWWLNPYLNSGFVDPGVGVWRDILPPRSDVKINYITLDPQAAGNDWEMRAMLDGAAAIVTSIVCPAGLHYCHLEADRADLLWNANVTPFGTDEFIEFKTAQIQFRRTLNAFPGAPNATARGRLQSL